MTVDMATAAMIAPRPAAHGGAIRGQDEGLRIAHVSKRYASRDGASTVALSDISLDVGVSEFVTLVGASGCGKSTLLRLVCGLISPSAGTIMLGGLPVREPRDDTAMVFQAPTLLPWATILDNVLFPLRMLGTLAPTSRDGALNLLDLVGLAGFEHKYPRELSGGMQQRAAICRGLVQQPSVLLMDEPFGSLDALTREEMSLELLRIWSENPMTVLFVTHSISEAVLLADRVVVMSPRPGRVADVIPIHLPRPRHFDQLAHPDAQDAVRRIRGIIYADRGA